MTYDEYWHTPEASRPPPENTDEETLCKRVVARGVNPYEREDIPESFEVIEAPEGWVTAALGSIPKKFCPKQAVCICSPTGTGKTTLVSYITKFCRGNGKVLLLEPRTMIAEQQKMILSTSLKSKWKDVKDPLAFRYNDEYEDVGLTVMTYQKFAVRYKSMDLSKYSWVIMDEIHFVHTDVLFSANIDGLFTKLPRLFADAKRVYMSATPEAVLDDISRVEAEAMSECSPGRICYRESCGKMLYYKFPDRLDRVKLHYYGTRQEIVELVKKYPGDKFVIFVAARENGDGSTAGSFVKLLQDEDITVDYLDRYKKDTQTWEYVCHMQDFQARVLVCTSVLDCGINLKNPALKHIVVESTDRTELIQMIGRKRLKDGEQVNVYVANVDEDTVDYRLSQVNEWLEIADECRRAFTDDAHFSLLWRGWTDEMPGRPFEHLLYPTGDGRLKVKPAAYNTLRRRQATLERLKRDLVNSGDSAFPMLVHEWLGQPESYSEMNWLIRSLYSTDKKALLSFLMEHAEEPIPASEWPGVLQTLRELVIKVVKKQHDDTRQLGWKALNDRLKEAELPYVIIPGENESYMIQREE